MNGKRISHEYSSVIFKRGIRTYEHIYRRNDKETRNSITMAGLVMVIVSGVYPLGMAAPICTTPSLRFCRLIRGMKRN